MVLATRPGAGGAAAERRRSAECREDVPEFTIHASNASQPRAVLAASDSSEAFQLFQLSQRCQRCERLRGGEGEGGICMSGWLADGKSKKSKDTMTGQLDLGRGQGLETVRAHP